MTVTVSNLPYKFEDGMRVCHADGNLFIVTRVDVGDSGLWCVFGDANIYSNMRDFVADIDHPGTRGLLLQQYRDASGHARACVTFYTDGDSDDDALPCFTGPWGVDSAEDPDRNIIVGEGESEGAAILDALTRLAASKAAAEDAAGLVRVSDTLADVRLDRIESMLVTISERVGRLEDWMMTP